MLKNHLVIISMLAILFTNGCGTAITLMLHYTSEIKKTYPSSIEETTAASVIALDKLNIRIVENSRGVVSTKIKGDRPDGIPVTLIFTVIAEKITQLGIRSDFIGAIKMEDSKYLHTHIEEQLNNKRPLVSYFKKKHKGLSKPTATPL